METELLKRYLQQVGIFTEEEIQYSLPFFKDKPYLRTPILYRKEPFVGKRLLLIQEHFDPITVLLQARK